MQYIAIHCLFLSCFVLTNALFAQTHEHKFTVLEVSASFDGTPIKNERPLSLRLTSHSRDTFEIASIRFENQYLIPITGLLKAAVLESESTSIDFWSLSMLYTHNDTLIIFDNIAVKHLNKPYISASIKLHSSKLVNTVQYYATIIDPSLGWVSSHEGKVVH